MKCRCAMCFFGGRLPSAELQRLPRCEAAATRVQQKTKGRSRLRNRKGVTSDIAIKAHTPKQNLYPDENVLTYL